MDLTASLQQEFGPAVKVEAAGSGHTVAAVMPQAVAVPQDAMAMAALVAWCGRKQVPFVTVGGGTKMHIGGPPRSCDLLISTASLNTVLEHDVGNATVNAGAGIALRELDRAVSDQKQFVPLEGDAGSTLGGVIATNHSGINRLKYGTPRDLVVGLEACLTDGRVVKAGSKVVKNVSGYDLNKLFIGSHGTLGVLTSVILRLRPNTAARQSWQASYSSWEALAAAVSTILEGPFEPTGLRVVIDDSGLHLTARFEGGTAAVATQLAHLPEGTAMDGWPHLERHPAPVSLRAGLPLTRAMQWARRAQDAAATHVAWDCGTGVVHAAFATLPDWASLRRAAVEAGGFMVVESAPDDARTPDMVWGPPPSSFALMRRLKASFDPAGCCAPGRFVGGL